jgi:hypothetical protein
MEDDKRVTAGELLLLQEQVLQGEEEKKYDYWVAAQAYEPTVAENRRPTPEQVAVMSDDEIFDRLGVDVDDRWTPHSKFLLSEYRFIYGGAQIPDELSDTELQDALQRIKDQRRTRMNNYGRAELDWIYKPNPVKEFMATVRQTNEAAKELQKKLDKVDDRPIDRVTCVDLTGERLIDDAIRECLRVLRLKNPDYSGNSGDRLHQFRSVGEDIGVTPEQALWVYMHKHLSAIRRYCKDGRVDSEGIRGRIVDTINYLLFLYSLTPDPE